MHCKVQLEFTQLIMMHIDGVHDIVKKIFDSLGNFVSMSIFFDTNFKVHKVHFVLSKIGFV